MPFLFLSGALSEKLLVVLLAMIPLGELRGSIPYAVLGLKMEWPEAFVLSAIGNFIPVVPFLLFLEAFAHRLMKYPWWERFFAWSSARARRKGASIERSDESLERIARHRVGGPVLAWMEARMGGRENLLELFKAIALALFVGVPLPLTGAWSGCIAGFVFRIPLRFSIPAIAAGILIAGVLVTLAVLGIINAQVFIGHFGR